MGAEFQREVSPLIPGVLSGGKTGAQKIHGIAAGFGPSVLLMDLSDEIIKVDNEEGGCGLEAADDH